MNTDQLNQALVELITPSLEQAIKTAVNNIQRGFIPATKENIGIKEAADLRGVKVSTMYLDHFHKKFPPDVCFHIGKKLAFNREKYMVWISDYGYNR